MESKNPAYLPSIGRLLGFAAGATTTLSDRRLRGRGLTLRQWVVMTALWRKAGITESELAEYCRTTPSALNRLLDRMVEGGLVRRRRDPEDGRRVRVELDAKGRKLKPLLGFNEEINAILLQGFSRSEARQVVSLLERMVENAESALEGE
jgi:DNA-binding MarR family transcriptional regulator